MPRRLTADLAVRHTALLGEGPRWDAACGAAALGRHRGRCAARLRPASGDDRAVVLGGRVTRRRRSRAREVLVAQAARLAVVDLEDGTAETIAEVPHDADRRLNDGACDARGRFWVGSMALDERSGRRRALPLRGRRAGARHRSCLALERARLVARRALHVLRRLPRGPRRRVRLRPGDGHDRPAPHIRRDRPARRHPDGLAVDDDGAVWLALWGGGCGAGGTRRRARSTRSSTCRYGRSPRAASVAMTAARSTSRPLR